MTVILRKRVTLPPAPPADSGASLPRSLLAKLAGPTGSGITSTPAKARYKCTLPGPQGPTDPEAPTRRAQAWTDPTRRDRLPTTWECIKCGAVRHSAPPAGWHKDGCPSPRAEASPASSAPEVPEVHPVLIYSPPAAPRVAVSRSERLSALRRFKLSAEAELLPPLPKREE